MREVGPETKKNELTILFCLASEMYFSVFASEW